MHERLNGLKPSPSVQMYLGSWTTREQKTNDYPRVYEAKFPNSSIKNSTG